MPVERSAGGTTITGNAILGLRGLMALRGLEMHVKFGGKMRLTRSATPGNLVAIAGEFTGKKYSSRMKGVQQAIADLHELLADKSLDQLGETRQVNALVGGVAADLQS